MKTKLYNVTSVSEMADELGSLRAEIETLQAAAKGLEDILKASNVVEAKGSLFRVSISYGVETKSVAWKKIAEKFNPSRQLVTANTKVSVSDRVRVTAMKKEA